MTDSWTFTSLDRGYAPLQFVRAGAVRSDATIAGGIAARGRAP